MKKGEVITCNDGWKLFDAEKYPPKQCLYVVAASQEDVAKGMTVEEMSRFKYFVYVNSTHFFSEFEMPHFNILFLKGWEKNSQSRRIDFDMINFAVKHKLKVIGYKGGEHGNLLDQASNQMEAAFHGFLQEGKPIDSVKFHPEVMKNQPEHLKFEG